MLKSSHQVDPKPKIVPRVRVIDLGSSDAAQWSVGDPWPRFKRKHTMTCHDTTS